MLTRKTSPKRGLAGLLASSEQDRSSPSQGGAKEKTKAPAALGAVPAHAPGVARKRASVVEPSSGAEDSSSQP